MSAVREPNLWMPSIPQYMALAEAMHDNDEICIANYYHPFQACENDLRDYFIETAIEVLQQLRRDGWQMEYRPAGAVRTFGL